MSLSAVGIARPIAPHRQLEVGIVRARLRVIRPVPLFEHHDAHRLLRDQPGATPGYLTDHELRTLHVLDEQDLHVSFVGFQFEAELVGERFL